MKWETVNEFINNNELSEESQLKLVWCEAKPRRVSSQTRGQIPRNPPPRELGDITGEQEGVFGGESVSVMEGESVTLYINDTEIHEGDDMMWNFGAKNDPFTQINKEAGIFSMSDGPDGRFRDRLLLNHKTGDLTITNTRITDAGFYKLQISGAKLSSKTFNVTVNARLPVPVITSNSSQCSSSSKCVLVCSVVNVTQVTLSWYKGNSLLSSISVSDLNSSLSLPLEVEYQENNIYSCVINNPIRNQTKHLNITEVCQTCSDLDSSLVHMVLISAAAGSLLILVAFVIFCIYKKCTKIAQTQEEASKKRKSQNKMKSKGADAVYENVAMKR
ncbi:hepatocyte cell adhesion molecule-like [Xyrauchen texanus]|uniref:hepatocyte cell adhesion molecule-like n=1 Tax=Xyrauchen texanus TaxID=154827 RepID=UPI002242B773|nr:hepatocyte cell adhesion molecule-like [Xyrauchen texanus]